MHITLTDYATMTFFIMSVAFSPALVWDTRLDGRSMNVGLDG